MAGLEYRKIEGDELKRRLTDFEPWQLIEGQLARKFEFKTYKDGLVFATAVGHVADRMDHHPDIHIGYAKVEIRMNTHAVDGLSPYDFELARRIDLLAGGLA